MEKELFFYRDDGWLNRVNLNEIIYLKADDNYVIFYASEYFYKARTTLESVMNSLERYTFIQIHRSYAVAADYIKAIGTDSIIVATEPLLELPLSKKHLSDLMTYVTVFESRSGCGCTVHPEPDIEIEENGS